MGRTRLIYYSAVGAALIAWFAWRAWHPDQITVRLQRGGEVEVNGERVTLDQVDERLRELDADSTRKTVTISADADVPAGKLVELVDRVHAAGVADPRFETRP